MSIPSGQQAWADISGDSIYNLGQAARQGHQTIPEELLGHGRNWSCPRLVSGLGGGAQMPLRSSRPGAELGLKAVQRANAVGSLRTGVLCSDRKGQQGPGPPALELMVT